MDTDNGATIIEVKPGGSMFIFDNCKISATNPDYRFCFKVEGTAFEMRNSELSDCSRTGFDDYASPASMGLYIMTNNAIIDSNRITNSPCGITVNSSGVIITNNTIINPNPEETGIYLFYAENCRIEGNYIDSGTLGKPLSFLNSNNNEILNNTILGMWIRLYNSSNNIIDNNYIICLNHGIALMYGCDNNIVKNNTISSDETGIYVMGWGNQIIGNTVRAAEYEPGEGIYLINAYNTVVTNNELYDMSDGRGIWLRHSSNNLIRENTISANPTLDLGNLGTSGLLLFSKSSHNILQDNYILGFPKGIGLFYSCDSNYVTGNTVIDSQHHPIVIDKSDGNVIYADNQFSDQNIPIYEDGENIWNYTGPVLEPKEPTRPDYNDFIRYIVTGTEVIENQTIKIGHLNINDGASLTLRNVNLLVSAQIEKEHNDIVGGPDTTGINVLPGGALYIYDSKIMGVDYGNGFDMYIQSGASFEMKNSEVHDCGNEWWYGGLQLQGAENVILENNIFKHTALRIFYPASNVQIHNNQFIDCYSAIVLENDNNTEIIGNTIDGTARHAIAGWSRNTSVRDNNIKNIWGMGIALSNALIEGNNISNIHNPFAAIESFGNEPELEIYSNIISFANRGIVHRGDLGSISKNIISDCEYGMEIGRNILVDKNTVFDCTYGISGGTLTNNKVSNCLIGMQGYEILNNEIDSCRTGILCYMEISNSIVTGNVITECDTGFNAWSPENVIYGNDFINNKIQAFDWLPTFNVWDFEETGNYWSDYSGVDIDNNGIGDTPYLIPSTGGNILDNFPQMSPTTQSIFSFVEMDGITHNQLSAGDSNKVITRFTLQKSASDSSKVFEWIGIRIDRIGKGVAGDVSSIKIWEDINNNSIVENDIDSLLGSGIFNEGESYISFYSDEVITTDPSYYLVAIDVSDYIATSDTKIGISLKDSTYFICKNPAKVINDNFPFSSNEIRILDITKFELPTSYSLSQNYPNPFNPITTFHYNIPKESDVSITIYDMLGRQINQLISKKQPIGNYSVQWNGDDNNGNLVGTGIYFYQIQTGDFVQTKKMVLMK